MSSSSTLSREELCKKRRAAVEETRTNNAIEKAETAEEVSAQLDTLCPPASGFKFKAINVTTGPNLGPMFKSSGNIHSLALGSPSGIPGAGSKVIVTHYDLYCRIPSPEISGEQLFHFIRVQFGVEVDKNIKPKLNESGNSYCFLRCKSEKDLEYLLNNMDDVTMPNGKFGDFDEPIRVRMKKK